MSNWPSNDAILYIRDQSRRRDIRIRVNVKAHVSAAGPLTSLTRSSTPVFLKISFAILTISSLNSSVTISACVSLVPSYQASAENPLYVPTSRTRGEREYQGSVLGKLRWLGIGAMKTTNLVLERSIGPSRSSIGPAELMTSCPHRRSSSTCNPSVL